MNKSVDFKHISLYEGPEESPGYLLWKVSTRWRSAIEKALKPLNLTHPQFVILASLAWLTKDNYKVSQVTIGKMVELDPNTTSQILRGLERKKFIKRIQSVDERSKNPIITTSGSQTLSKALPAVEQADKQFFERLKKPELKKLIQSFQTLTS